MHGIGKKQSLKLFKSKTTGDICIIPFALNQGNTSKCKTGYFSGHIIFAVARFCHIADFNFRGCRYGAF